MGIVVGRAYYLLILDKYNILFKDTNQAQQLFFLITDFFFFVTYLFDVGQYFGLNPNQFQWVCFFLNNLCIVL